MKTLITAVAFTVSVFALGALAQDKSVTIREADISLYEANIRLVPDGGCQLQAGYRITVGGVSVSPAPQERAFNGARCNALRTAVLQAAKLDIGVGDGGLP